MANKNDLMVEELTWSDVRERVHAVNPTFANLVDDINPDNTHTLFLAKYPYGSRVVDKGKMQLPLVGGGLVRLFDPLVSKKIQKSIGYMFGTNPMAMVLEKTLDLFIPTNDRNVLFALVEQGNIFGIWPLLEDVLQGKMFSTPIPMWDMTAGVRSIFLLPKISDVSAFNKIQKQYDLKSDAPKHLQDQWTVFKEICNHPAFEQTWKTEVLLFSKKWINSLEHIKWHSLRTYFSKLAWKSCEFWRNQFCWDLTYSRIQSERGIKPCPFVTDIASHLLAMSIGAVPGFRPAVNSIAAPIDGLRHVFENEYGIRYAPIFLTPGNFNVFDDDSEPVYYTYQYHTAIRLAQKSSKRSSILTDLYNTRSLINKYLMDIKSSDLNIEQTTLLEMAKRVNFNFYHSISDEHTRMTSYKELLETEPCFIQAREMCQVQTLPKHVAVLNGCVQISKKT